MKFSTLFILLFFFVFSFTKAEDVSVIQPSESTFQELVAKEKKAYAEEAAKVKTGESKYNPVPVIMSHLADGHDWHFWGEGENSFTIPLPVILWDNGLKIFMSSKFHHNEEVAEVDLSLIHI